MTVTKHQWSVMCCGVSRGKAGRLGRGARVRLAASCSPQSCPRAQRGRELGWGCDRPVLCALSTGLQWHQQCAVAGLSQHGCTRGCNELCWQAVGEAPCPRAVMSCQVSAPGTSGTAHPCNTAASTSLYPDTAFLLPGPIPPAVPASFLLFLFCSKDACSRAVPTCAIPFSEPPCRCSGLGAVGSLLARNGC